MQNETNDHHCECKVGQVITLHNLSELDNELRKRWQGSGVEKHSLRELEQYFNKQVLEQRLVDADIQVLDGEVDNFYRLLSGDASEGMQTQARRRLEKNDVDVDELKPNFVSHQTIYRHLKNCLGVEQTVDTQDDKNRTEKELDRLTRLQNRSEVVSEASLNRLEKSGDIIMGEFDVIINFRVACGDCGSHMNISEVVQQGGCDCRNSDGIENAHRFTH